MKTWEQNCQSYVSVDECRWQIITSGGKVASGCQRKSLRKEKPEFKLPGGEGE